METLIDPAPVHVVDISGAVQTVATHVDVKVFPLIEWGDGGGTEGSTLHVAS